jgi:putative CocE/NonD family hydrolase
MRSSPPLRDAEPLSTKPMRIEPKLELRGTQLAGWTPSAGGTVLAKGILFDEDVRIPMPDGVEIVADLFRPAGQSRVPVLVAWAVYIKDTERLGGGPFIDESGVCPYVIGCGYAVLRVQPRGTGRSGGTAPEEMSGVQERADCHAAIEWAAVQPWCDGKVGMTGMSYFAIAQLLVAGTRPPSLKAIFPYKAMTDIYRHGFYKGGAAFSGIIELFAAFEKLKPPNIPAGLRHALSHVLNHPRFEMQMSDPAKTERTVRGFLRRKPPPQAALRGYVNRMFDRVFDDGDYWSSKSPCASIDAIDIPVCIATDFGAQDLHLFGAFELWHRLRVDKWLFIGPPEYSFPWSNYQRELVAWYDWQLKGIDNGYAKLPRVRYWLRGAERWESAADWPLPNAVAHRLYLAAPTPGAPTPGASTPAPASLALFNDLPAPAHASLLAIPSTSFKIPQVDAIEAQVLRFTTPPFETDTRMVGPVALNLVLSATAIDTYVIVRLCDIAPDGRRSKLSWGWLLASHRSIDAGRSNPTEIVHDHRSSSARQLIPGERTPLRFSLNPIANLFRAGHRLELEVGARPELLSTEAGEGFDMFYWDPVPYRSRNTLYFGGDEPSYLELNRLP